MGVSLCDKVYGCLAAAFVGSAMGVVTEGWTVEEIEEKFGIVKGLYDHHDEKDLQFPDFHYKVHRADAGTTEDGVERIKLMCTAIIEKGDRISVDDLGRIWLRDLDPKNFGYLYEPCDEVFYHLLKAGMPACDCGWYTKWLGLVSFARSCHPIGIINACDPEQAALDAFDVGRIYQPRHGYGQDWAAAVAAAIAEAMKPDATLDSVVEASMKYVAYAVQDELAESLKVARECDSWIQLRRRLGRVYDTGRHLSRFPTTIYAEAMAHECVVKGIAIFYVTRGDPKEAMTAGTNFARGADNIAAIAAGIAGAFSGSSTVPQEWVKMVDDATVDNEYTVSRRTIKETADGMYEAIKKKIAKSKEVISTLEKML